MSERGLSSGRPDFEAVQHLISAIEARPGWSEADLWIGEHVSHKPWDYSKELREAGCRQQPVGADMGYWRWWPSRARCAELARTATGERFETLARGMWLDA